MTQLKHTLERIDALYEKASGGTWRVEIDEEMGGILCIKNEIEVFRLADDLLQKDADLICELVNAWPAIRAALADSVTPGGDELARIKQAFDGARCALMQGKGLFDTYQHFYTQVKNILSDGQAQPEAGAGLRERIAKIIRDRAFIASDGTVYNPYEIADAILALGLGAADGWQPISTAPKDGTLILLELDDGSIKLGRYHESPTYKFLWWSEVSAPLRDPTHWVPLPSPPADTGNGGGE